MNKMIAIAIWSILIFTVTAVDPPVYNFSYHIAFDETYTVNKSSYEVNGLLFYDPINNRERVDRTNGRYNKFCGPIIPNTNTPCIQYTVNNKRWIAFPQKSVCCFCCDSAHGCGILSPDWLRDSEYKGEEKILDTIYDKWSKDGVVGYNYLWTAKDNDHTPRRLDENGVHTTDYSIHSFKKMNFEEGVFALPQYCNTEKLVNCPLESLCG